jgi:HEAT repeat protein
LSELGPRARSAAPALKRALADEHPWVRLQAAHALVKVGLPKDALAVLIQSWSELPRAGQQGRGQIQLERQFQILGDLSRVASERQALTPFLQEIAGDTDWRLARKAAEALKKLAPKGPTGAGR